MNVFQKFVNWYKRPKTRTEDFLEFLFIFVPIAFVIRTIGFGLYKVPTGSMETTMLTGEGFFADKFTPLLGNLKYGDVISFNDPLFKYSDNPLVNAWQMYAWGPVNWTKRIVGMPGDHIKGVIEDGKPVIYRNSEKLDEPYVNKYPLIQSANQYRDRQVYLKSYDPDKSLEDQPFYRMNNDEVKLGKMVAQKMGEADIRYPNTPNSDKGIVGDRKGKTFDEYDIQLASDEYWAMGDNRQGSLDCRGWGPLKRKFIHGKIVFRIWSHDDDDNSWMIFDLLFHPIDFFQRFRWSRCLNFIY